YALSWSQPASSSAPCAASATSGSNPIMHNDDDVGSIQARLLRVLMVSLLRLLILCGFVTWFVASRVANDAYDHALLDPMMDIVQNVRQGADGPTLPLSTREQAAAVRWIGPRVLPGARSAWRCSRRSLSGAPPTHR